MQYIYLHGFASGPQSTKAQALRSHFQTRDITLHIPDLNQGDFAHLTLTRQIQQVVPLVTPDTVLIGSSLGGVVATWVAETTAVSRLILLAPAFNFLNQWLPRLGTRALQHWQQSGQLSVYHYAEQRQLPLAQTFLTDARQYDDTTLRRPLPTLILHGEQDDVVSLAGSQQYAASRPWVRLTVLSTDHSMTDVIDVIWQEVQAFCDLG
ncbi:MAG: YqiA/YcfP family alpha/beta fold hydrolase [Cyanobacteria bacterium J06632_22]